jgi:transposase
MDIKELQRMGLSQRAIARQTGHSRNTVARILSQATPAPFSTPARASHLDPYKAYIKKQYEQYQLSSVRLLAEIRPMGYSGSIDIVRRYVQTLAMQQRACARATVRYETPPGAQAQVDWASCGRLPDGRSVYAFVFVLGFSRADYVEFTISMSLPTLLGCHMNAFEYFGGIPHSILYDNMKQVRLGPARLSPQLVDFAGHYGFTVKTHQPYRPRTKGKVERLVDYVKDNFLAGRIFEDLADMNAQARHWLDHTANVRIHGVTGRRPVDLLAEERAALTPVRAISPYQIGEQLERKVDAEGFVHAYGSRYSVPPSYIERQVLVSAFDQRIVVRQLQTGGKGGLIIAEHDRASTSGQCVADKEHIAQLWKATLERSRPQAKGDPALREWRATGWDAPVDSAPLSSYEEVGAL